jgi:hypothetical protein
VVGEFLPWVGLLLSTATALGWVLKLVMVLDWLLPLRWSWPVVGFVLVVMPLLVVLVSWLLFALLEFVVLFCQVSFVLSLCGLLAGTRGLYGSCGQSVPVVAL